MSWTSCNATPQFVCNVTFSFYLQQCNNLLLYICCNTFPLAFFLCCKTFFYFIFLIYF
jgi:hypothetical protein